MGKVNRIWLLCVYNRRGQHVAHGEGVNLWLRCGGVTQSSSCSSHIIQDDALAVLRAWRSSLRADSEILSFASPCYPLGM